MTYISCALYVEAASLIKHYSMKKDSSYTTYQVFKGEDITVIITGAGMVPSAIVLTDYLAHIIPNSNDSFINYGTCASSNEELSTGEVCLIDQITDITTGRTYIPDILLVHGFRESSLITSPIIINTNDVDRCCLYDMEAAALYQTAIKHFAAHRIFFIKVVSDYGDGVPDAARLSRIVNDSMSSLLDFIQKLNDFTPEPVTDITSSDKVLINRLTDDLRLSQTQQASLLCYFRYYASRGNNLRDYIFAFYEHNDLHIKSKTEGKKYYEYITGDLIQ